MAEVIRWELIVPGEDQEVVGVGGGHAVSAVLKRWGSRAKGSGSGSRAKEKAKAPTWAEALAEEKLLESLFDRIGDLGSLIGVIDRAAGRRGPDFSRKLDAHPHLERCIQESLKLYLKKESLKRAAGLKAIEMKKFLPKEKTEMKKFSVLESLLAHPEGAEQFKQFLKDQQLVLFHEYRRRRSEERDPDFSGMSEADRAAEADRLRQEAFQEASCLEEGDPERRRLEARARILDFDPKQGGIYFNSYWLEDLSTFDLGEESPIGPMRFTKKVFEDNKAEVCTAVNILSVQVACSDVGFPIQVYGTVIARDSTDFKRIYLFHRDRDHCQLINSEDEQLILTGPKRGLAMLDGNYVETDLKIRDHQGQDRELSKGILTIKGIVGRSLEKCKVERLSLSTRLSTVKMVYAVVVSAVEATIAIEVVEGEFCGTVTAHTTSIKKSFPRGRNIVGCKPQGTTDIMSSISRENHLLNRALVFSLYLNPKWPAPVARHPTSTSSDLNMEPPIDYEAQVEEEIIAELDQNMHPPLDHDIGFDLNMEAPHDGLDLNLPLEDENHIAYQGGIDLNLERPVAAAPIQYKKVAKTVQDLVPIVQQAFQEYSPRKANRIYLTLQLVWKEAMKVQGSNKYKIPHVKRQSLERQGTEP